jgi:uncharacterized membrane protein
MAEEAGRSPNNHQREVDPAVAPWPPLESSDRILAALSYIFWIVALIVLLLNETNDKPLLRAHAIQSLGVAVCAYLYGALAAVVFVCVAVVTFGIGVLFMWVIFFVPLALQLYWAYLAYDRPAALVEIPWLTAVMSQQGWLNRAPS